MVRSELIRQLTEENPALTPEKVAAVVDLFFDRIAAQMAVGGRVELRGFGVFAGRSRRARTGHNPRTGSSMPVTAKHVPHFKPGREMHVRLNPADMADDDPVE